MKKHGEKKPSQVSAMSDIRRRAEERVRKTKSESPPPGPDALEKLVHELEVHQVELEIQNEELRSALAEVEELRDRYIELYDFAPIGYFNIDQEGIVTEANLTGAAILGGDRSALIGRPFTQYIPAAFQDAFYLYMKQVFESAGKETAEMQLKRKNGSQFTAHLESIAKGSTGFRMALIDISERKKTEDALRIQTDHLAEANREIEAFTYSVSHDLRSPLRAMDGFTKMILKEYGSAMDAELRRKFDVVRENTKLMSDLIEGLLNLSRIGRREISRSEVDMRQKFREVWQVLKAEHPGREIEFILGDMPPAVGDKGLLRQVVHNLLANAVKFTNLKNRKAAIETGGCREGEEVVYYIKDNGAGFDMQYYDKLFKVFQRLHSLSEFEGTGIGLAIVQNIIHRHGGRVWAKGKVGKGATFFFSLPDSK